MTQRVLVTGSEGFVGRVLCTALEKAGHDVLGCDRNVTSSPRRFTCDMADETNVVNLVQWAGPIDCVYHLAAMTFVPSANKSPAAVMSANLQGTIHLATAMKTYVPGARLLFIGSAESYGPPQFTPMTEEHPLNPSSPYAISKAAADQFCWFYQKSAGLDIVRVRPFNHSGAGQSDRFVLSSFARQIAEIEAGKRAPIIETGDLSASRDFLHVDDVIRAYLDLVRLGKAGEAYNICSGKAWRIDEALNLLLGMSNVSIHTRVDPERLRPVDIPLVLGAHDKLTRETGWTPRISFETLLTELLGYWRQEIAKA